MWYDILWYVKWGCGIALLLMGLYRRYKIRKGDWR